MAGIDRWLHYTVTTIDRFHCILGKVFDNHSLLTCSVRCELRLPNSHSLIPTPRMPIAIASLLIDPHSQSIDLHSQYIDSTPSLLISTPSLYPGASIPTPITLHSLPVQSIDLHFHCTDSHSQSIDLHFHCTDSHSQSIDLHFHCTDSHSQHILLILTSSMLISTPVP